MSSTLLFYCMGLRGVRLRNANYLKYANGGSPFRNTFTSPPHVVIWGDQVHFAFLQVVTTIVVICAFFGFIVVIVLVCCLLKTTVYRALATSGFIIWIIAGIYPL